MHNMYMYCDCDSASHPARTNGMRVIMSSEAEPLLFKRGNNLANETYPVDELEFTTFVSDSKGLVCSGVYRVDLVRASLHAHKRFFARWLAGLATVRGRPLRASW